MQINLKVNSFELEIWDNEASLCTFYTVRDEGAALNETDKFFEKHHAIEEYEEPTSMLLNFLLKQLAKIMELKNIFLIDMKMKLKDCRFKERLACMIFAIIFHGSPLGFMPCALEKT